MSCSISSETLSAYLDGKHRELEPHITSCSTCTTSLQTFQHTQQAVHVIMQQIPVLSEPDIAQGLRQIRFKIEQAQKASWSVRLRQFFSDMWLLERTRVAVVALALVLGLLAAPVAFYLFDHDRTPQLPAPGGIEAVHFQHTVPK